MLVCTHESAQRLDVEAAVGVRDERPGDSQHARVPREVALGQLRQLPVEAGRQVIADLADLLVDDVEIVDQPFGSRRDDPLLANRLREGAIRLQQGARVVPDPRRERTPVPRILGDALGRGQALGVLLEPLDAEQLGPDGLVGIREGSAR